MNSIREITGRLRKSHIDEASREEMIKAMQNNKTYKEAKNIVETHGYDIDPHCYVTVYPDGSRFINFSVRGNDRFDPDIYFHDRYGREYEFTIQTPSYGALNLEEHSKFLERVTNAHKMVEELSKLDMFTLYEYQREE